MRTREKYLAEFKQADHLDEKRKKEIGAYWTPPEIAFKMARLMDLKKRGNILDPCCGGGNLLAAAMDTYPFLQEEDLYGLDIDPEAIYRSIELFPFGNFQVGDCLKDPIDNDDFWNKPTYELWDEYKQKKGSMRMKNVKQTIKKEIRKGLLRLKFYGCRLFSNFKRR